MAYFDPSDEESIEKIREFFSPAQVDQTLRSALQMCWMMLPKERRNVEEVEREFRRLVDRVLSDLRDDGQTFRTTPPGE